MAEITKKDFTHCCGISQIFLAGDQNKKLGYRDHFETNTGLSIAFPDDPKWHGLLGRRGFTLHPSGAFYWANTHKEWDDDKVLEPPALGIGYTRGYDAEGAVTSVPHLHVENKLQPVSIIYAFQQALAYNTYSQGKNGKYIWQVWDYKTAIEKALDRCTNPVVLVDLASLQIAVSHHALLELGFEVVNKFVNPKHDSKNVLYCKVL